MNLEDFFALKRELLSRYEHIIYQDTRLLDAATLNDVERAALGIALKEISSDASINEELFLRKAIELHPTYPMSHFELAQCLCTQGRIDEALHSYLEAVAVSDANPEFDSSNGQSLAEYFFMSPKDEGLAGLCLERAASCFISLNNLEAAEKYSRESLERLSDYPASCLQLAQILVERKERGEITCFDANEVEGLFETAIKRGQDETLQIALNDFGFFLLGKNELERAAELFEKACCEKPGFPNSWIGLAKVYHAMGDLDQAIAHIDIAIETANQKDEMELFREAINFREIVRKKINARSQELAFN